MNYGGNLPDWHQYNVSQTNEVTPSTQNVNSGHLAFIPGVNPPTLNAINLGSESLNKHQNDANFNPRNFQSYNNVSNGPNIPNNSPLASMVQMQNCIGHYGSPNTRNPMLDNINASVDPRNATIGTINDETGYRNNQVPFHGPIGHLSGPNCNLNASSGPGSGPGPVPGSRTNSGAGLGTNPGNGTGPGPMYGPGPRHGPTQGHSSGSGNMGPRNTNISSVPSSGKPGPTASFIPCKGLCCNSDPSINYQQWEKYGSYQTNTSYRDNVHPSGYQMENRHFGNNCNFRKDNLEGKDVMGNIMPNASAIDHRRNFASDYKYHKDHLMHRNYPTSTGMFHNYPMQNYNYPTEHQKYAYPVKEHTKTSNMNVSNSGMIKHQEQNFIAQQQKFSNKQFQYQNGNMLPKGVPTMNVNMNMTTSAQNAYYNSQFQRNIPAEMPHECQEITDSSAMVNRMQNIYMHNSPTQHQVYQHKIAVQKFSIENHLRELSRIPGYQSHPKYKECVLRYRELKLQQSSGYQNPVQQAARAPTPVNTAVPPINLQFDQNGMLINSSYLPDSFPKVHPPTVEQAPETIDKQSKDQTIAVVPNVGKCRQPQQPEQLIIPQQNEHVPSSCAETFQKQSHFSMHKDFNQNQLKVQTSESHSFDTLNVNADNETMMQQKASKEFANKPDLDVRQFLANWDETDDEEGTANISDAVLSETTPVVVVSYENVNLASKTPQGAEESKRNNFCPNEPSENRKGNEANVIAAEGLTISYSTPDNPEVAKTTKRTIGEGVMKPGSIIHCISNGPDEIPTIHIVDNLEISNILGASNDQVIQTLEKQKTISFFRESSSNEAEEIVRENAEEQDKGDTRVLPANYGAPLDEVNKSATMEDSNIPETMQASTVSLNNEELRTLSESGKNNMDVSESMELKKQHSFEESHNPDDISLPDLPTSECTPISTTLNTPIHSDSEESSQNMEDLSISTNPIEVVQNSPVISFTQLNSEEKIKNKSLDTLGLEFQKENRYKSNDSNCDPHQEITLDNFDFSSTSKVKSSEAVKNKQVKTLRTNVTRKKVFLIDGKESDSRVSDTCGPLTSMEYELEVHQELVEGEKNSNRETPGHTHEGRHKSARRSIEMLRPTIQSGESVDNANFNANLNSTEFGNELHVLKNERDLFRRKKMKTSAVPTAASCSTTSEVDLSLKKRTKEAGTWEDKCAEKYTEKNLMQRKDADRSKPSRCSEARKFDDSSSSKGGEHSVCHTTSQYKHYFVAVIKDNVTLSDKRSHGTTEKIASEKPTEFPSKVNNINTKEVTEEADTGRRHATSKAVSTLHENVHSQTSKLLQKDLKTVDGDVRYTAEEIRLLREYKKKKERLHQFHNTHTDNRDDKPRPRSHFPKSVEKDSQKSVENTFCQEKSSEQIKQSNEVATTSKVCLEQSSPQSSVVSLNSEKPEAQEGSKGYSCSKSLNVKHTDFGIQVANVNLKIKDSDAGKELILGSKGQEHANESMEGIKIEINVSCTDRGSKGQEQNRRLSYDDRNMYDNDNSLCYSSSLDCKRRAHVKDQEDTVKLIEKSYRVPEKSDVAMLDASETSQARNDTDLRSSATLKRDRRASLEANSETSSIVSKETCSLTSDGQSFNKSTCNNASSKDITKMEVIAVAKPAIDHLDVIKSKSAISNTAIADANNKVKGKSKLEDREDNCTHVDDDRPVRVQKHGAANVADVLGIMEKDVSSMAHLKSSKKLPETNLVELSTKSLNSLSNLDFNFDKLEYKKCSAVTHLNRNYRLDEVLDEDGHSVKWKKPKIDDIFEDCDIFQSSSGYVNPIFSSIDKLEDLHTVPVYTTKDGKISYSPNRKFTYHELMMEARKRETSSSGKKSHYADTWNSYYNTKFQKLYKRKRHHGFSDRRKHEYKDTKYLYDRKRNYSDEFYSKGSVKYKDYVHSIRNNNAVWSDHCKVDKIYSSSDSDDETADRGKDRITDTNSCKKSPAIESRSGTISVSHQNEVIGELNLECKEDKGDDDDVFNKSKRMDLEETQLVQSDMSNADQENENVVQAKVSNVEQENVDNNCRDDLTSHMESDTPTTSLQLDLEKESVDNVDKIKASVMNNVKHMQENKNSNDECTDNIESTIIFENRENVNSKDEPLASKLLNKESLLNENKQTSSLYDLKRKEDEGIISTETDLKMQTEDSDINVPDMKTNSIEAENNSENTEDANFTETDLTNPVESKDEKTEKISELQVDSNNVIEEISQSLELPEKFDNISEKIMEESETNITEENIAEDKEEEVQFDEKIGNENEAHEEGTSKEIEENIEFSEHQNDEKSLNDDFSLDQEKSESRTVWTAGTSDQRNSSEHIFVETVEHEIDISTNSDQVDNVIVEEQNLHELNNVIVEEHNFELDDTSAEEQNFNGFTNDEMATEYSNIKDVAIFNEDEIKLVSGEIGRNTEETSIELEATHNLKNELSDEPSDEPSDDPPSVSEQETNPSRNSSVEKEMPVLNIYYTAKNAPIMNVAENRNETEVDEQKEEKHHSLNQVSCKNSTNSLDSNTDAKAIPKLVIKKNEALESSESFSRHDVKLSSETRPKIPKMIIVKNRSRSVTPTIENLEKNKSDKAKSLVSEQRGEGMNVDNSDSESYTLKYNTYESKVPKVKIKLEEISSKDLKLYLKRKAAKNFSKVKIKKLKTPESKRFKVEDSSGTEATDSDEEGRSLQESIISDVETERIPKLKLKRHEENKSLSPEKSKGKESNISKVFSKKTKKTKEEDFKHAVVKSSSSTAVINDELKKKYPQCITEKVPKVIIKRTQIGTEFKCEISKSKRTSAAETSKWQPQVKLQRLEVLDHMVKDLKRSKITLNDKLDSLKRATININDIIKNDPIYGGKAKLCRSNSVSNLSAVKCKQRRLSDSCYMKAGSKAAVELGCNFDDMASFRSDSSESRNFRMKEKRKPFSKGGREDCEQNDDSEEEMRETETKHSFRNILTKESNDTVVVKKEYSSVEIKEDTLATKNKFQNSATHSRGFENNDNLIIEVDSSDESQTTIEILPASPDSSEDEAKNVEFENVSGTNMEDAIPTQLELELDLIDNDNMRSGIAKLDRASYSKSMYGNDGSTEKYFSEFQHTSRNSFNRDSVDQAAQNLEKKSSNYFYSNDLLVKEVLAAKETLRKCLSRTQNEDLEGKRSRPKTVAEKKQGLSFSLVDLGKSLDKSEDSSCNSDKDQVKADSKSKGSEKKGYNKSPSHEVDTKEIEKKYSKHQNQTYSTECPTASTCGNSSVPEQVTISLKGSKTFGNQATLNRVSGNDSDLTNKDSEESQEEKSVKKTSSSTGERKNNGAKTKEDNMPLLVPEFALNFDSSSDRDSSRSPPVITNQEEAEQVMEEVKLIESKVINQTEKIEENKIHSYEDCEMTIADIITQLAYHEKATIKHKRYCNLCERWFPTTSRHRRHLAGYQHRYMELAQRKSIHALFILFTGKPCPRLLPANIIRSDCSIGELTPLQIAVQDVAKCVGYAQQKDKTKE